MVTVAGLASLASMAASVPSPGAAFTAKDGQVLGRTLGYVGDGMTGVTIVGIVFAPANPASQRDAEAVLAVIGGDLAAGRVRLQARLIPLDQLTAVTGIAALYVTAGLEANMVPIVDAAQRLRVPTISADLACVQSGGCVVGFSTEPTVQILIDKAAAERTGVRFMQAFRMLVREK
jgi:hypothetical protein